MNNRDVRTDNSTLPVLNIAEIRTDGGTQNRSTDPSIVNLYAALMAAEAAFPPLRVWFDGTCYWLADGFHRLAAAKKCGFKYITAAVLSGSLEDALWDSFNANSQHGLRRNRLDMVALIERALKHANASSLSNVELAKHLGIPEATVRRWRKRLSSPSDEDGSSRIVNRKGTSYTLHIQKLGKRSDQQHIRQKSLQQLKRELLEMGMAGSPEVTPFIDIIDYWMFGGGHSAECLNMMKPLLGVAKQSQG
jgi:hypothetical protein